METIFILLSILQSAAISLGMGSSTIAIANFFVAIADGKIDPIERKMMGVVYVILRIAMVAILLTTSIVIALKIYVLNIELRIVDFCYLTLISVLFLNAALMTFKAMPSTVGPALQASSWYTMGILTAGIPLGILGYTYWQFLLGYATVFVLAISLVNGLMAYLKK